MTDFRSPDFAAEVEAHRAVKNFWKWVGVLAICAAASYLAYTITTNPDAVSSFFERLFAH
jgi:hypothetical protein